MNSFFRMKRRFDCKKLLKGGDTSQLGKAIENNFAILLFLSGPAPKKIKSTLPDKVICKVASGLREAVKEAGLL